MRFLENLKLIKLAGSFGDCCTIVDMSGASDEFLKGQGQPRPTAACWNPEQSSLGWAQKIRSNHKPLFAPRDDKVFVFQLFASGDPLISLEMGQFEAQVAFRGFQFDPLFLSRM